MDTAQVIQFWGQKPILGSNPLMGPKPQGRRDRIYLTFQQLQPPGLSKVCSIRLEDLLWWLWSLSHMSGRRQVTEVERAAGNRQGRNRGVGWCESQSPSWTLCPVSPLRSDEETQSRTLESPWHTLLWDLFCRLPLFVSYAVFSFKEMPRKGWVGSRREPSRGERRAGKCGGAEKKKE